MYCPKCYRLNPDENEKCSKCGYRLKKSVHTSVKNENKMKFCSHCGNKISQDAVVCPKCGCAANTQQQDRPSFVLDMISVFVPLIGLILFMLYFIYRRTTAHIIILTKNMPKWFKRQKRHSCATFWQNPR